MTVLNTKPPRCDYDGTSTTDTYDYDFLVTNRSEIHVWERDADGGERLLTLDADYSVTMLTTNTGTVKRLSGNLPTGFHWTILLALDFTQPTSVNRQGEFYEDVLERMADRNTMLVKQVAETIGRTVTLPVTLSKVSTEVSNYVEGGAFGLISDGAGGYKVVMVANSGAQQTADLANTSSASKGSGMVGHNDTLVYPEGSTGGFLNKLKSYANALYGAGMSGFSYALAYAANTVGWALKGLMDRCTLLEARTYQGATIGYKASCTGLSAVITMTADKVTVRNAAGLTQELSNVSVSLNTATTGANGLDTGLLGANTWYHKFIIWNPSNPTVPAALCSLSSTGPTLPTGYTHWKRVGAFITDGSGNKRPLSMSWVGNRAQYKPAAGSNLTGLLAIATGSSVAWGTAVAVGTFVPTTAIAIQVMLMLGNVSSGQWAAAAPSAGYSTAGVAPLYMINGGTGGITLNLVGSFVLESTNLYWGCSAGSASLAILGWEEAA